MSFLQNMTLIFFRPANSSSADSNIFLLQTTNGETIPLEFGLLNLPPCFDSAKQYESASTVGNRTDNSSVQHGDSIQAVVYVGVVLLVYALIIMMMIATNIKKQRLEGEDADYYEEFLQKRDHFKYAQMVAEARLSVEPHMKRAASIHPSNPLFNVEQFQTGNSPSSGRAPSIVIQSA